MEVWITKGEYVWGEGEREEGEQGRESKVWQVRLPVSFIAPFLTAFSIYPLAQAPSGRSGKCLIYMSVNTLHSSWEPSEPHQELVRRTLLDEKFISRTRWYIKKEYINGKDLGKCEDMKGKHIKESHATKTWKKIGNEMKKQGRFIYLLFMRMSLLQGRERALPLLPRLH